MIDLTPSSDTDGATGVETGPGSVAGTPGWVKVFGVIAFIVVMLVVFAMLSGGSHGPGRHDQSRGPGGDMPPAVALTLGQRQP